MILRKKAETATSITLEWLPVAGAEGYLFYKDGVRVSRTFDPARRTVKFSKPFETLGVQAIVFSVTDSGIYPPVPPQPKVAPVTYNEELGSDARYCTTGLPKNAAGNFFDQYAQYDNNGLQLGGRLAGTRGHEVPGLKGSRQMDGKGPCDPYQWAGVSYPPWPAGSYER